MQADREYRKNDLHPETLTNKELGDSIGEQLINSPNTGTPLERLMAEALRRLITVQPDTDSKEPPELKDLSIILERYGFVHAARTPGELITELVDVFNENQVVTSQPLPRGQ